MKKMLLPLMLMLLLASAALAESPTPTPTATPVPDLIAQPDATPRPITTATPRPADAPLPEDVFIGHAIELARRVDMLAESSVYFTYNNLANVSEECWELVSRGDHTTPSRIFSLSGEALHQVLTGGDEQSATWFDLSRPELRRDMVHALISMMQMKLDSDAHMATSFLARAKVFVWDGPDSCGFLVLLYEDAVPAVISWYSDQGALQMSAYLLPDEALEACVSAEDVAAWFESWNMPRVTFEEVTW